jgi:phage terminase Nu1 subunit (DNA packaging protein)
MTGEIIVKGKAAVAEHFGVSVRQVRNWEMAGMPGRSGRDYDLVKIQLWRDQRPGVRGRAPADPDAHGQLQLQPRKELEEERLLKNRADKLELENRRRRGELIERAEIEQLFITRIMALKQRLLSLPRELPPKLIVCRSEREQEAVIARAVRLLLEAFSRPLPEGLGGGGGGDGLESG